YRLLRCAAFTWGSRLRASSTSAAGRPSMIRKRAVRAFVNPMSSHRTNSSLCPLATFFSAPSGFEVRKTAMISVGSAGAGLGLTGKSILSFAGTRHQTPTSNETIANDGLFMGFSTSSHRQRAGRGKYSSPRRAMTRNKHHKFCAPECAALLPVVGGSGRRRQPRTGVGRLQEPAEDCNASHPRALLFSLLDR